MSLRHVTVEGPRMWLGWLRRVVVERRILFSSFVIGGAFILGAFGAYVQGPTITAEVFVVSHMQACYGAEAQSACFKEAAARTLDRFSIREVLAVFARYEREPGFFTTCHEVAHYIGQEGYQRLGSVGKVYAQSDRTCLGGVFHGAIEGYFMARGLLLDGANDVVVASEVPHICGALIQYERPQYFTEYHHGLGHALMYATHDELPRALALCDNLETTARQHLCYTGAFMQNANNYGSGDHPTAMIRPDDPLYPCDVLDERYARICYSYAVLERYQGDVERSVELCDSIPDTFSADCFQTMGRNLTLYSDNPEMLRRRCDSVPATSDRAACTAGVAYNLVVRYGPESALPFAFCASDSDEVVRRACYHALGSAVRVQMKNQQDAAEACRWIDDARSREWCVGSDV